MPSRRPAASRGPTTGLSAPPEAEGDPASSPAEEGLAEETGAAELQNDEDAGDGDGDGAEAGAAAQAEADADAEDVVEEDIAADGEESGEESGGDSGGAATASEQGSAAVEGPADDEDVDESSVDASGEEADAEESAEESDEESYSAQYYGQYYDLPDEPTSGWLGAVPEGNQGGGLGIDGMSDEIRDYMEDAEEFDEDLWWEYDPDVATVCALPERGSENLGPLEEGPEDGSTGVWGLLAEQEFWAVYNEYYDILAFVPEHQLWLEGTEQPAQVYAGCGVAPGQSTSPASHVGQEHHDDGPNDSSHDPDPQGAPADLADWELYYALGLNDPSEDLMPPGALQKLYDHPAYTGADHGEAERAQPSHSEDAGHRDASAHDGDQLADTGADSGTLAVGAGLFVLIGGALAAFSHRARLLGRRG